MLSRFQVLFWEGVLLEVQTQCFGKSHSIISIKFLSCEILIFENQTHEFVILIEELIDRMLSVVIMRFYILYYFDFCWAIFRWIFLDWWMISVTHSRLIFLFRSSLERRTIGVVSSFRRSVCFIWIRVLVKHQFFELRDVGTRRSWVHLIYLKASICVTIVHASLFTMCH